MRLLSMIPIQIAVVFQILGGVLRYVKLEVMKKRLFWEKRWNPIRPLAVS